MLKKLFNLFKNKKDPRKSNGRKVLIVEDSNVDRNLIQSVLEKNAYSVYATSNGEDGLQLAKRERLDLILLDCDLPGISGVEVCQKIKDDKRTKDVPIIFLTGSSSPSNIVNCFDLGAEHYLTKPVGSKELLKQIDVVLSG